MNSVVIDDLFNFKISVPTFLFTLKSDISILC